VKFIALKPSTAERVLKTSNRYWLAGILFSITHGLLKVRHATQLGGRLPISFCQTGRLAREAKKLRNSETWGEKDLSDEAQREVKQLALAKYVEPIGTP
jgi:peroxin-11B